MARGKTPYIIESNDDVQKARLAYSVCYSTIYGFEFNSNVEDGNTGRFIAVSSNKTKMTTYLPPAASFLRILCNILYINKSGKSKANFTQFVAMFKRPALYNQKFGEIQYQSKNKKEAYLYHYEFFEGLQRDSC